MRHRIAAGLVACAVLAVPAAGEAAPHPAQEQMQAVREFLKTREGTVGVAVVDSSGRVRSAGARGPFVSASVVKSMLLVSHLRTAAHQDRRLTRADRSRLWRMITHSSNRSATWIHARVGNDRLRSLARRAGMTGFSICCSWTTASASARDWAVFFSRLERLTPKRFRPYAVRLLSSIQRRRSWGIPAKARPRGFDVFHKAGWRPTFRGYLVHQAASVSRGDAELSLAVLTDGNRAHRYGIGTIAGVARRILGGAGG